jgi:hypothetical protein
MYVQINVIQSTPANPYTRLPYTLLQRCDNDKKKQPAYFLVGVLPLILLLLFSPEGVMAIPLGLEDFDALLLRERAFEGVAFSFTGDASTGVALFLAGFGCFTSFAGMDGSIWNQRIIREPIMIKAMPIERS